MARRFRQFAAILPAFILSVGIFGQEPDMGDAARRGFHWFYVTDRAFGGICDHLRLNVDQQLIADLFYQEYIQELKKLNEDVLRVTWEEGRREIAQLRQEWFNTISERTHLTAADKEWAEDLAHQFYTHSARPYERVLRVRVESMHIVDEHTSALLGELENLLIGNEQRARFQEVPRILRRTVLLARASDFPADFGTPDLKQVLQEVVLELEASGRPLDDHLQSDVWLLVSDLEEREDMLLLEAVRRMRHVPHRNVLGGDESSREYQHARRRKAREWARRYDVVSSSLNAIKAVLRSGNREDAADMVEKGFRNQFCPSYARTRWHDIILERIEVLKLNDHVHLALLNLLNEHRRLIDAISARAISAGVRAKREHSIEWGTAEVQMEYAAAVLEIHRTEQQAYRRALIVLSPDQRELIESWCIQPATGEIRGELLGPWIPDTSRRRLQSGD